MSKISDAILHTDIKKKATSTVLEVNNITCADGHNVWVFVRDYGDNTWEIVDYMTGTYDKEVILAKLESLRIDSDDAIMGDRMIVSF